LDTEDEVPESSSGEDIPKYVPESSSQEESITSTSDLENTTTPALLDECLPGAELPVPIVLTGTKRKRFLEALPGKRDDGLDIDKTILSTAIPSMINMAVVPLVNSVDTFWVGRMGIALALAGQAAANQAFFTLFFLVNYLPTITAPLVASAVGSGNGEEAQQRVCESLFLSNLLGGLGTLLLVGFPHVGLSLILTKGAPALAYATPYLRWRAISMIPALIGSTGFAAFRGMLDTVTPLKVSVLTK
jgi:Na+-driven multidrug efflux pump